MKEAIGEKEVKTQFIITDFEKSMMNALNEEMSDFGASFSYFHLKKSIDRKIKTLGLQAKPV